MELFDRCRLYGVSPGDVGARALAMRHYFVKRGGDSWWSPAETMCLVNIDRTILFVWQRSKYRDDGQEGINCSLFRNEDSRLSSEVILEAEQLAVTCWGPTRAYTYVDAGQVASSNPGYCFIKAGWRKIGKSKSGKLLLEKHLT